MDGSGKGGGALSAVAASGTSVTFIGTGEKPNALELYDSKKFVGRLLGMPDLEALIEHVNNAIKEANMNPEEITSGELNFETFYSQLKAMSKMGPVKNMLGMMGLADVPKDAVEQGEQKLKLYKNIIGSMTNEERKNGHIVREQSRGKRIASGSGTSEKDVRSLLSDFNRMKKFYELFKNDRSVRKNLSKFMQK